MKKGKKTISNLNMCNIKDKNESKQRERETGQPRPIINEGRKLKQIIIL